MVDVNDFDEDKLWKEVEKGSLVDHKGPKDYFAWVERIKANSAWIKREKRKTPKELWGDDKED